MPSIRCSSCQNYSILFTGVAKPLNEVERLRRSTTKLLDYKVQYRCPSCRHIGWTRYPTAQEMLIAIGGASPYTQVVLLFQGGKLPLENYGSYFRRVKALEVNVS